MKKEMSYQCLIKSYLNYNPSMSTEAIQKSGHYQKSLYLKLCELRRDFSDSRLFPAISLGPSRV